MVNNGICVNNYGIKISDALKLALTASISKRWGQCCSHVIQISISHTGILQVTFADQIGEAGHEKQDPKKLAFALFFNVKPYEAQRSGLLKDICPTFWSYLSRDQRALHLIFCNALPCLLLYPSGCHKQKYVCNLLVSGLQFTTASNWNEGGTACSSESFGTFSIIALSFHACQIWAICCRKYLVENDLHAFMPPHKAQKAFNVLDYRQTGQANLRDVRHAVAQIAQVWLILNLGLITSPMCHQYLVQYCKALWRPNWRVFACIMSW